MANTYISGGTFLVALLVGFITLFEMATRNRTMLINHYIYLTKEEILSFPDANIQDSLELKFYYG